MPTRRREDPLAQLVTVCCPPVRLADVRIHWRMPEPVDDTKPTLTSRTFRGGELFLGSPTQRIDSWKCKLGMAPRKDWLQQ